MVYFIRAKRTNLVKIGVCNALGLEKRLRQLQTGSPDTLVIFACMPDGERENERTIHETFKDLAVRGEWFKLDFSLFNFIKENAYVNPVEFDINWCEKLEIPKLSLQDEVGEAIKRRNSYPSAKPTFKRHHRVSEKLIVENFAKKKLFD